MARPGPGANHRPARHLQPQFHARRIHDDAFVERAAIFHDDRASMRQHGGVEMAYHGRILNLTTVVTTAIMIMGP